MTLGNTMPRNLIWPSIHVRPNSMGTMPGRSAALDCLDWLTPNGTLGPLPSCAKAAARSSDRPRFSRSGCRRTIDMVSFSKVSAFFLHRACIWYCVHAIDICQNMPCWRYVWCSDHLLIFSYFFRKIWDIKCEISAWYFDFMCNWALAWADIVRNFILALPRMTRWYCGNWDTYVISMLWFELPSIHDLFEIQFKVSKKFNSFKLLDTTFN